MRGLVSCSVLLRSFVAAAALTGVACGPRESPAGPSTSTSSTSAAEAQTKAATSSTSTSSSSASSPATAEDTSPDGQLAAAMRASDPALAAWMDQAADLRLQVLVTEVRPGDVPWPTYSFRADAEYIYPASAIKPFLATAALRFASSRAHKPIELMSRIIRCAHNRPHCEPPPADEDKDSEKAAEEEGRVISEDDDAGDSHKIRKKLRLGEEIHKLLSYSDNDSYDRLYDLVGHRELNESMADIGFPEVRFQHPTEGPADLRNTTLAVRLIRPSGQAISFSERQSDFTFAPLDIQGLGLGEKHQEGRGIVDGPMDFSVKNRATLHDMQRFLISLLFPNRTGAAKLGLTDSQRETLIAAMTRSPDPAAKIADHYPLAPGILDATRPKNLRYIGKAGKAFGFLLESAYIENQESHRAVFVAASVLANPDNIMNDDVYAYDEIARPALRAIGSAVAKRFLVDVPP